MDRKSVKLTTAQFAKLHHINKRTLHYYDNIGLFSPEYKGENGYRYYDYMQSIEFENILMLKELNMSIEEIKTYLKNPNSDDFIKISNNKIGEIDAEIKRLKNAKYILKQKRQQLEECSHMKDGEIKVIDCEEEFILMNSLQAADFDIEKLFDHLKQTWDIEQYRIGCGSYISIDKIKKNDFTEYDGIYTPMKRSRKGVKLTKLPGGKYIRAYMVGNYDRPQFLYKRILRFAEEHDLHLSGYAFEIGVNEFAVSNADEYITKITIKADLENKG